MTSSNLATESTTVRDLLIADLLHRIEFIEKAGTGIKRMRDEAHAQGCPEPTFEAAGFFTTTFLPNPAVRAQAEAQGRDQVTQQAGTKLALSRHQVEILAKCVEDQPLVALLLAAGRADRTKFRNQVLAPLLTAGWLEMTIPDKPRSSKQKYRTTELGRKILRKGEKGAS